MKCFECGTTEDIQQHHVVPKSRGGTKTVPLCYSCHRKAHHKSGTGSMNHRRLTSEGLRRASRRGVKLGGANPKTLEAVNKAQKARGDATFSRLAPSIQEAFGSGAVSNADVALFLNNAEVFTARGKLWTKHSIALYLRRFKKLNNIS